MIRPRHLACWAFATLLAATPAVAQQLYIFPEKGQDQAQQDADRGACHVWAVNQTGFDPTTDSNQPPPSQEAPKGGVVRGGARGAAVGVVAGAIAGDAGKGAAIGAASGGLIGGMRRRDQVANQQQQGRNWQAQQDAQRAEYRRALEACLEGKGYTVR